MLLGQQTQVDWWRQTVRVIASCWLSLGDAIFSQPLLPACERDMGCLASPVPMPLLSLKHPLGLFSTLVLGGRRHFNRSTEKITVSGVMLEFSYLKKKAKAKNYCVAFERILLLKYPLYTVNIHLSHFFFRSQWASVATHSQTHISSIVLIRGNI